MTHLAIRFLLELAALAGAVVVGASAGNPPLGFPGAAVAGVAFVAAWGLWIAPRARFALVPMARLLVGTALMLAVAVGLILVGQPTAGEILVAAIVANAVLLVVTKNVDPAAAGR
jgi:hypothetical protein